MNTTPTDTCFLDIEIGDQPVGRITLGLFGTVAPKACESFLELCRGAGPGGLGYKGTSFYRVVPGAFIQGGDVNNDNGTGGRTKFGQFFEDENLSVRVFKGCLACANCGPNTNSSNFLITLADAPWLTGKHVVFGRVTDGDKVIQAIAEARLGPNERPLLPVRVADCGVL